jgi:hypothetical protein
VASRAGDAIDPKRRTGDARRTGTLSYWRRRFLLGMLVGAALAAWVVPPV